MPQATNEHRARWGGADGIGPEKAMNFLEAKGFVIDTGNWHWRVPLDHTPTDKETDAMLFLVHEWDFGGFY